jgi:hypothetical protein
MERYDSMKNRTTIFSTANRKEKAVAIAIAARNLFLEQHPEYLPYQREIERILDKAGPPEKRLAVLAMLMEGKLLEMKTSLMQLSGILDVVAA